MSPTVLLQCVNFFLSQLLINIAILLVIQLGSNLWGKQKAKTEAIQEERKTEKDRKKERKGLRVRIQTGCWRSCSVLYNSCSLSTELLWNLHKTHMRPQRGFFFKSRETQGDDGAPGDQQQKLVHVSGSTPAHMTMRTNDCQPIDALFL